MIIYMWVQERVSTFASTYIYVYICSDVVLLDSCAMAYASYNGERVSCNSTMAYASSDGDSWCEYMYIYIYSIYALTNTIKDASKMCSTDIWNRVCAKENQLMSLQLPDAYCGILCAPYIGVWLPDFLSLIYDLFIEDYYALLVISMLVQTNITAYARPGTSTQAHCVISNLSVVSSCQGRFIFWLVTSFV